MCAVTFLDETGQLVDESQIDFAAVDVKPTGWVKDVVK